VFSSRRRAWGEDAVIKSIMLKDTVDWEFTIVREIAEAAVFFASFDSNGSPANH
jgi:hypothetical protein